MITIVDYGVGNIGALLNMFEFLGIDAEANRNGVDLAHAEKLLLPGVGAFDKAMSTLASLSLIAPLNEAVLGRGVPILGVCLGMQLLARGSEEGGQPGLGFVEADVVSIRVPPNSDLKVPNIGWAEVRPTRDSILFTLDMSPERFYFDHSYQLSCDDADDVVAVIDYGGPMPCAINSGTICGVQFHPEKSHRFGMRLLRSFAESA